MFDEIFFDDYTPFNAEEVEEIENNIKKLQEAEEGIKVLQEELKKTLEFAMKKIIAKSHCKITR